MKRYNPSEIEPKWQQVWEASKIYEADNNSDKPKYYALSFFPYPSGVGLHIGHTRNFTITDVIARYKRMTGHEVLHPLGWDSFGLPAENYAIKTGIPPQVTTKENTDNFRRQSKRLGMSIDWSREFGSTDPDYYKWTQWFFLLLYKRNLAYRQESAQWWCDICKTVLANEQVVNGCCWRHEDNPVVKKMLPQWFFKITDYAERLEADLENIDWPEGIKAMQRNWIGRSVGAQIDFTLEDSEERIPVFTTRADTLFGATFLVLAPEHSAVREITSSDHINEVEQYIENAKRKSDIDRMEQNRDKTGVFTGAYAINPINGQKIPVWIADYVLTSYGTGAIMAVPAHDQRDFEFAGAHELPVREVVKGDEDVACYGGEGRMINSGKYDGMASSEAREKIVADLAKKGVAFEKTNFKIRDWLISRQRYWGAPIPMIHCAKCGIVPVPEKDLPVVLPELKDFAPAGDGKSPLGRVEEWVNTECPECKGPATRETDTMDGFACSSWYFLRFADPHNNEAAFSRELAERWLPVDTYVGGAEHAVMHLLYARMWTKVMFDEGLISFDEPFKSLRNQGMLLAADGEKISKSKGNDIKPEEVIDSGYGADALRMIVLFLAPYDQSTPWSNEGLAGIYRFLARVWTLTQEFLHHKQQLSDGSTELQTELARAQHKAVKKVAQDIEHMGYNTAISAMMEWLNTMYKLKTQLPFAAAEQQWRQSLSVLAQLLAPFAPHLGEELWQQLGHETSVHKSAWPVWDDSLVSQATATIVIQVNGKVRANIAVAKGAPEAEVVDAALAEERIRQLLQEKPARVIFVPDRLINFVSK